MSRRIENSEILHLLQDQLNDQSECESESAELDSNDDIVLPAVNSSSDSAGFDPVDQEDKDRERRRGSRLYRCAAVFGIMVILLGTMCAYIISVTCGSPVPQEDPSENELPTYDFPFMSRSQWNARRPKETNKLTTPVPYVVIHHSYIPPACYDNDQCSQAMRSMQNFHMDDRGWWDIGYNFAVGSNGMAYEGRGWKTLGAHAKYFNSISIGICLIGDWTASLPPAEQLKTAQRLIEAGVTLGFIRPDYKLVGHRQVRDTECPGDTLFKEITTWDKYSPYPRSVGDLVNVKELSLSVREQLRNMTTVTVPVNANEIVH